MTGKEQLAIDLATRATQLADVHWLGPRTDTPELFADLDLFVLPSTEPEPYGIVVVEALASGAPVVVTDAGGAPEIVARRARERTTVPPGMPARSPTRSSASRRSRRMPRHGRGAIAATPAATGRIAEIFREAAERWSRAPLRPG